MNYVHRPCVLIAAFLVVGIGFQSTGHVRMPFLLALAACFLCCIFIFYRLKLFSSVASVCVMILFCGMIIQGEAQMLPKNDLGLWTWQEAANVSMIEGILDSPAIVRSTMHGIKTSFELSVKEVCTNKLQCVSPSGKVLVNIFRKEELNYGERIIMGGKLHKPFIGMTQGHYSYEEHLKRNGIYWVFSVGRKMPVRIISSHNGNVIHCHILKLHKHLRHLLEDHLNEFEAGFIQSLVLGGKYYMDSRTRDLFVRTGTAHILAISGMNVASMALLIFIVLNVFRLPRRGQIIFTIVGLVFYCLLTGSNPSVLRAVVMAIVLLMGVLIEREQDTLNSLGIAAVIILLMDPLNLFDVGFQLSFIGVFSIVYLYPPLYACFESWFKTPIEIMLGQMLFVSLAAWIGTLPLIAFYFQVVTPVSVFANIPIIPFISVLFMLGVGAVVFGLMLPPLAGLFAACIKFVLWGLMLIIEFFSRVPYGSFFVKEVSVSLIVVYYIILGMGILFLKRRNNVKVQGKMLHYLS
ncbi:MAG: ComEC/Rec2 family competence protein [Candidatus Omnitrophica bacterium]|nr:ComEC/Rec2 family competence protein [Candidatus Omnitrophota bacterium]